MLKVDALGDRLLGLFGAAGTRSFLTVRLCNSGTTWLQNHCWAPPTLTTDLHDRHLQVPLTRFTSGKMSSCVFSVLPKSSEELEAGEHRGEKEDLTYRLGDPGQPTFALRASSLRPWNGSGSSTYFSRLLRRRNVSGHIKL